MHPVVPEKAPFGVVALDKGTILPCEHALIKGMLEPLKVSYSVAGLIALSVAIRRSLFRYRIK